MKEGGVVIVILRRVKVLENERAFVFRDGAFEGVLPPGVHWMLDPLFRLKVEVMSIRNGWLIHPDLELMVKSGRLGPEVRVVDLKTHQRAIVWADGRLELVLKPGVYAHADGAAFMVFSNDGQRWAGLFSYKGENPNTGRFWTGTKRGSDPGTCPNWAGGIEQQMMKDIEEFGRTRVYGINFDSDSRE